jgi:3' terminal RNA ribose 2'-O-methyltransferase Hen1
VQLQCDDIVHTELHEQRLERVVAWLRAEGARSVVDFGCGRGVLLQRLGREPAFSRLLGVDASREALALARQEVLTHGAEHVDLLNASLTDPALSVDEFDAGVLLETIEHVNPGELSSLERTVLATARPRFLIVTTPNAEYNPLLDLPPGAFRDPDHRFEWTRARFRQWCRRVAQRQGYRVSFQGIGEQDPDRGTPTQAALFRRS